MRWEWFLINFRMGAYSFGSSARIPLYQQILVEEKKWLTKEEFYEVLTLAQILPGPNLVNLVAYIGYRLFKNRALAFLGVMALAVPGAFLAVLLVTVLPMQNPLLERLFQGFSLASISISLVFVSGLLESIGIRLRPEWDKKLLARSFVFAVVAALSLLAIPLFWILLVGISLGLLVEFLL